MTEAERELGRDAVHGFMVRLARWIGPCFPHHGRLLSQELSHPRMTSDRWNRITAVLSSLHSIPGEPFTPAEHAVRWLSLSAVAVATRMSASMFGYARDPDACLRFAVSQSEELNRRMIDG